MSAGNAGIEAIVKTVAREWGPAGIRLNVLGPGLFAVERNAELISRPEFRAAVEWRVACDAWANCGRPSTP